MRALAAALIALLAGCSTLDTVVQPERRNTLEFNVDYETAYRKITQAFERCYSPTAIRSQIYRDNKTARVYMAGQGGTAGSVYDIRSAGKDVTIIDFYDDICAICTSELTRKRVERLKRWINEDSTSCD
jgi:ribosomal protein L23